jgi:hypothetical protein
MLAALSIFFAVAAYELHRFLGSPGGLPAIAALAASYLLPASIALWVSADARERRYRTPYDFDSLIFFLWPVLAPIYLFHTRGWRGIGILGLFVVVFFGSILFAMLMGYPASVQP